MHPNVMDCKIILKIQLNKVVPRGLQVECFHFFKMEFGFKMVIESFAFLVLNNF